MYNYTQKKLRNSKADAIIHYIALEQGDLSMSEVDPTFSLLAPEHIEPLAMIVALQYNANQCEREALKFEDSRLDEEAKSKRQQRDRYIVKRNKLLAGAAIPVQKNYVTWKEWCLEKRRITIETVQGIDALNNAIVTARNRSPQARSAEQQELVESYQDADTFAALQTARQEALLILEKNVFVE